MEKDGGGVPARLVATTGGEASFDGWDAEDLLARMWQAGDVGAVGVQRDYLKVLEGVETKMLIMPSRTDLYFPPENSETAVKHLKNGVFALIPTVWGHIAGGVLMRLMLSGWMSAC